MTRTHTPAFRRPILSLVYRGLAWGLLIPGTVGGIVTICDEPDGLDVIIGAIAILIAVITCVIMLGISQLIDYIGSTAHNTEVIATLIGDHIGTFARSPLRTAVPIPTDSAPPPTIVSSHTVSCPSCAAALDPSTLRPGRNQCPSCHVKFLAE
jgi:hypothetical protein